MLLCVCSVVSFVCIRIHDIQLGSCKNIYIYVYISCNAQNTDRHNTGHIFYWPFSKVCMIIISPNGNSNAIKYLIMIWCIDASPAHRGYSIPLGDAIYFFCSFFSCVESMLLLLLLLLSLKLLLFILRFACNLFFQSHTIRILFTRKKKSNTQPPTESLVNRQ